MNKIKFLIFNFCFAERSSNSDVFICKSCHWVIFSFINSSRQQVRLSSFLTFSRQSRIDIWWSILVLWICEIRKGFNVFYCCVKCVFFVLTIFDVTVAALPGQNPLYVIIHSMQMKGKQKRALKEANNSENDSLLQRSYGAHGFISNSLLLRPVAIKRFRF